MKKHDRKERGEKGQWFYIKRSLKFFVLALYPLWFGLAAQHKQFFAIGLLCIIIGIIQACYPQLAKFFAPLNNKERGEYDVVYRAEEAIKHKIDEINKQ